MGHDQGCGELPLLLLSVDPSMPVIFEIVRRFFQCRWPDSLAVASADEVDKQPVEQMRHIVLLLARSTLAEALDQEDGL